MVRCRTPEIPNGGMVTSYRDSYTYGDRILFKCNPGFKPKDDRDDSLCEADSRWHPLPECIEGKYVIYFDQCLILTILSVALNNQFFPFPFPSWQILVQLLLQEEIFQEVNCIMIILRH